MQNEGPPDLSCVRHDTVLACAGQSHPVSSRQGLLGSTLLNLEGVAVTDLLVCSVHRGEDPEQNHSDWAFLRAAGSFHLAQRPSQEFR